VNVFLHRSLKFGSLALVAGTLSATTATAQIKMTGANTTQTRDPNIPDPKAERMLVSFFRAGSPAEAKAAIDLAEDIRTELRDKNWDVLWTVPREFMNKVLNESSFKPDEPVAVSDLMILSKQPMTAAMEIVDGTLTKRADGMFQLETHFYYGGNAAETEPLPVVVGKNPDAIKKEFVNRYWKWREQLKEYKTCHDALVGSSYDKAVTSGRKMMANKDHGQLAELCLLSGLSGTEASLKANAKEILTISLAILGRDSTNRVALQNTAFGYQAQGDSANAAQYWKKIFSLDPTNQQNARSAIRALMQAGSPDSALPIVKRLRAASPQDVDAITMEMNVYRLLGQRKEVLKTAEDLIAVDTAVMTLEFVTNMVGLAQQDSDTAGQLVWLGRGTKKFPREVRFWMGTYDVLFKKGDVPGALNAAKKAHEIDGKNVEALSAILGLSLRLDQDDSVIAYSRKAVVAGVPQATVANGMLPILQKLQKAAGANTDSAALWQMVLDKANQIDSIVPASAGGARYYGAHASAMLGVNALQSIGDPTEIAKKVNNDVTKLPPAEKARICEAIAKTAAYFAQTQMKIGVGPQGGGGAFNAAAAADLMRQVPFQAPGQLETYFRCK
jgi:tetratricopeptide (TPR) repeat protein